MTTPVDAPFKVLQRASEDWLQSGQVLEPTLEHKLRKLPPHERAEVRRILSSMFLRKTIKRVLSEAHTQAQLHSWHRMVIDQRIEAAVAGPHARSSITYNPELIKGNSDARIELPT